MEVYTYQSHFMSSSSQISFRHLVIRVKDFISSAVSMVIGTVVSAIVTFFFALGMFFNLFVFCILYIVFEFDYSWLIFMNLCWIFYYQKDMKNK